MEEKSNSWKQKILEEMENKIKSWMLATFLLGS